MHMAICDTEHIAQEVSQHSGRGFRPPNFQGTEAV